MKKKILFFLILIIISGGLAFAKDAIINFNQVFKQEFIKLVSQEEGLTLFETEKILKDELYDIENNQNLKNELIEELSLGIEGINDNKTRETILVKFNSLKNIIDPLLLYNEIILLFNKIDNYYADEFIETEKYNFIIERDEIITNLEIELQYINENVVKKNIESKIKLLKNIKDEDLFFNNLNVIEDSYNKYINTLDKTTSLTTESDINNKNIILKNLNSEIANISNLEFKNSVKILLNELKSKENMDVFFNSVDNIYNILDDHYESIGIEKFDNDFDFLESKEELIKELQEELYKNTFDDIKIKNDLLLEIELIGNIKDEDLFFDKINDIYYQFDYYIDDHIIEKNNIDEYFEEENGEDYNINKIH